MKVCLKLMISAWHQEFIWCIMPRVEPAVKLTGDGAQYFEERKSADSTSSFWFHASSMS